MIDAAMIKQDKVTNVIYVDEINMELFVAEGMELIDIRPYGLTMGDYREGEDWYRDIDGVKTQLPLPDPVTEPDERDEALKLLGVEI